MKLENLTLLYEFPIQSPHLCDGSVTTVGNGYICTPQLRIELEEEPVDSQENPDVILF